MEYYYVIEIYVFLLNIFMQIINAINNSGFKIDFEISSLLVSFEVTLIAITFALLPFLVQGKNDNFLGYKKSDWILYKCKNDSWIKKMLNKIYLESTQFNDLMYSWLFNIFIIFFSVFLLIIEQYIMIVALFIVFIICFYNKIKEYLSFITTEKFKKEVGKDFLKELKKSKNNCIRKIEKLEYENLSEVRDTFKFILDNYENENMKVIFITFINEIIKKNKAEYVYVYFEEISKKFDKLDIEIDINCLIFFFENIVNDRNYDEIMILINNIFIYDRKKVLKCKKNNSVMREIYNSILLNNNIVITKRRILESIIKIVTTTDQIDSDNKENYFGYVYDLFRFIIDEKEEIGIEVILGILNDHSEKYIITMKNPNNEIYMYVNLCLVSYLYYLSKIEVEPYITKDDNEYYLNLANSIVDKYKKNAILYDDNLDIDILLNYLDNKSTNWEKHNANQFYVTGKTPKVSNMIKDIKRTLLIIFNKSRNININERTLNEFKFTTKENCIEHQVLDRILKIAEFLTFNLNEQDVDEYIKKIIKYANQIKMIEDDFEKQTNNENDISRLNTKLNNNISKLKIFNNTNDFEGENIKGSSFYPCDMNLTNIDMIEKIQYMKITCEIEKKIQEIIKNTNLKELRTTSDEFDTFAGYNNQTFLYLSPENDFWIEDDKHGIKYKETINKFRNKAFFDTRNERYILEKYQCKLNKITVSEYNMEGDCLDKQTAKHKNNDKYYVKDKYGFDIEFTKSEIETYCLKRYKCYKFEYEFKISISNEGNCMIVEEDK